MSAVIFSVLPVLLDVLPFLSTAVSNELFYFSQQMLEQR